MSDDRDELRSAYQAILDEQSDSGSRSDHDSDRYSNLEAEGARLGRYGEGLKVVGIAIGSLAVVAALYLGFATEGIGPGLGAVVGVLGVAGGGGLHAMGTTIAAFGEGLLAVRDTAVNSRITAEALKSRPKKRKR